MKKGSRVPSAKGIEAGVQRAVFEAIDQVNPKFPAQWRVKKALNAKLYDKKTRPLDSLQLVSLVVAVEGRLQELFDVDLSLATAESFSQKNSPFATVGSLIEFSSSVVSKALGG